MSNDGIGLGVADVELMLVDVVLVEKDVDAPFDEFVVLVVEDEPLLGAVCSESTDLRFVRFSVARLPTEVVLQE